MSESEDSQPANDLCEIFYFGRPRALRLAVKLPKMLSDRFGILGAGGHGCCDRNGGNVDAFFLNAS
jgi:hypothetical protein